MSELMKSSGLVSMIRNRRARREIYSQSAYWDAKVGEYDDQAVSMWPNNHLNACYTREQLAMIDRYLLDVAGWTILDLGCGTGRISRHLAGRGAIVHGVDFSEKSIELARKSSPGPNPTFETGSVFALDHQQRYDAILVFGVVTVACKTRSELFDVMRRVRDALKLDGILVLIEPIHDSFLHRVLKLPLREFTATLIEAGFTVCEINPLHFWPARLALSYFQWPGWVTRVGYSVGQGFLKVMGRSSGDYKAILAKPSRTP